MLFTPLVSAEKAKAAMKSSGSLTAAVVVATRSTQELMKVAAAARALRFKGTPIVFARYGDNKAAAVKQLTADIKTAGFLPPTAVIGVSTSSLDDALADLGFKIGTFLGSAPEQVGMTKAKRDKADQSADNIRVRFASICRNCESVIHEHFYYISPMQEGTPGKYQHSDATETQWDPVRQQYNVLDTSDRCRSGC